MHGLRTKSVWSLVNLMMTKTSTEFLLTFGDHHEHQQPGSAGTDPDHQQTFFDVGKWNLLNPTAQQTGGAL